MKAIGYIVIFPGGGVTYAVKSASPKRMKKLDELFFGGRYATLFPTPQAARAAIKHTDARRVMFNGKTMAEEFGTPIIKPVHLPDGGNE